MKIYVVESSATDGVFSSYEKAKDYANSQQDLACQIICFELDDPKQFEEMNVFGAWYKEDGTPIEIGPDGINLT